MIFFITAFIPLFILIISNFYIDNDYNDRKEFGKFKKTIYKIGKWFYDHDIIFLIGMIVAGIAICMLVFILIFNGMKNSIEIEYDEEYAKITYSVQNEYVHDDFNLVNKEIINDIQNWNTTIKQKQKYQKNFWIGIFYPNIFDKYELIEYPQHITSQEVSS